MNKDIIPSGKKLTGWAQSFKTGIAQNFGALGLSSTDAGNIGQLCDEIIQQRTITNQALHHSKAMVSKEKEVHKKNVKLLRRYINKMKSNQVTTNQLVGLGVKTHHPKPDENTYEAKIKVDIETEMIRVRFKKYGIDRMEFWGSCNGGAYQRLDSRTLSPFLFKPEPLATHLPQRWHIKAVAIYKDKLFGAWSNVHTVLYESSLEGGV